MSVLVSRIFSKEMKLILPIVFGVIGIVMLSVITPDIWTTNRNYSASQKLTPAQKMERLRSCLLESGLAEGRPEGDFALDPITETVNGKEKTVAFSYRFPDSVFENETMALIIDNCKKRASKR